MRPERGFTLMEVLVALLLLSLFAVVSYRALDAVLDSARRASAEMEHWRELATAFARVDSDLANAVQRFDAQHAASDGLHAGIGDDKVAQFDIVRLLPEDEDEGLMRVGYRCADKALSRLVWPDAMDNAAAPKVFALLDGLQSCAFSFMDSVGQWRTTWVPLSSQPLPRAVALDIVEADGTPLRRVWLVQ